MRGRLPDAWRAGGRDLGLAVGSATSRWRAEPDFLLVGAQRCGTTSLFRALLGHPHIMRANLHKGVNYFDVSYDRGPSWYRGHFPLRVTTQRRAAPGQDHAQVFEASGYYMFHPHAPSRIAVDLPQVKVVALVRDPVERAFSAYKHEKARGFESESFERALDLEDSRIEPELERMRQDPGYYSTTYRHQAYKRRGHYAEQLHEFVDRLGADRVHVMQSELFFEEPVVQFEKLLLFLGLPRVLPDSFDRYNPRPSEPMDSAVAARLRKHFDEHDRALEVLTGERPAWHR